MPTIHISNEVHALLKTIKKEKRIKNMNEVLLRLLSKSNDDIDSMLICPLSQKPCNKEQCPIWIRIWKSHAFPDYYFEFEGCGLIHKVPWILKKKEGEAKT
jgi:predicted CopG family antitoxin